MSILVCGGAGYIGSNMTAMLAAEGLEPIVYDNLSKGHLASSFSWGQIGRAEGAGRERGKEGESQGEGGASRDVGTRRPTATRCCEPFRGRTWAPIICYMGLDVGLDGG